MSLDIERLKTDPTYWSEVAPESATHYCEIDGSFFDPNKPCSECISRPSPVEWDGEGLPPVGTECDLTLGFTEFGKVLITYVGRGVFCYRKHGASDEFTGATSDATFRPRRTKEQLEREDLIAIICDHSPLKPDGHYAPSLARAIQQLYHKQEAS